MKKILLGLGFLFVCAYLALAFWTPKILVESETRLPCGPEEAWAQLTESEKFRVWNPEIQKLEAVSEGEPGVGYQEDITLLEDGQPNVYRSEIVTFEPPSRLEVRLSGGPLGASPMLVSYRLEPEGEGVRLEYSSTWAPAEAWMKPLVSVIQGAAEENLRVSMSRLRAQIEASAKAP